MTKLQLYKARFIEALVSGTDEDIAEARELYNKEFKSLVKDTV